MSKVNQSAPVLGLQIGRILSWVRRYAFELFIILLILHICLTRGLSFKVNVHDPQSGLPGAVMEWVGERSTSEAGFLSAFSWIGRLVQSGTTTQLGSLGIRTSAGHLAAVQSDEFSNDARVRAEHAGTLGQGSISSVAQNVSLLSSASSAGPATRAIQSAATQEAGRDHFNSVAQTDDPAPHINNLTLVLSPTYFSRHNIPAHILQSKRDRLQNYLDTYSPLAQDEMRKHGIPASITLAQALLESNAGDSRLATQSNNHFGIKCKSRCLGCTCRNYGDDTRYDMFRVFTSVAESFEEHSALLLTQRYNRLHTYGKDYNRWAHGLKACGYATDPNYGNKLVKIIEGLDLDRYDVV
ncbi:MAG: glucosaminidase domain-containing protein [Bacteroidota bacterium]